MQRSYAYWFLSAAFVTSVFLVSWGQRKVGPAPRLEEWEFTELVAHLNHAGLGLRVVSPQQNGVIANTVFLTTTDKGFNEVNRLIKDPRRIGEWWGVLYCERVKGRDSTLWTSQWGGDCLVLGPFVFYGDRELLKQVRVALGNVNR